MNEYKPCPFCGGTDIDYNSETGYNDGGFWSWIECNDCGATAKTKEDWDNRTKETNND